MRIAKIQCVSVCEVKKKKKEGKTLKKMKLNYSSHQQYLRVV